MNAITRGGWLLALCAVALLLAPTVYAGVPRFDHIVIVVMENHSDSTLIGNRRLPYLDHLAKTYGYDDNYFGVTHPSLPNYVAMLTGDIWGSHSDNPTQRFPHTSLISELERAGLSWKGYMQSLPKPGYTGGFWPDNPRTALYVEKHDPFMLLPAVRQHPRLARKVVPLKRLTVDLAKDRLPSFSYIVPDVCHDMHGQPGRGPCSNTRKLLAAGDAFLHVWVRRIMKSAAWRTGNNVLFITWDESDHATPYDKGGPDAPVVQAGARVKPSGGIYGGGRVPLIAVWNEFTGPVRCHQWADHYSLLKTIEQAWHLAYLGHAADPLQVHGLSCFFDTKNGQRSR